MRGRPIFSEIYEELEGRHLYVCESCIRDTGLRSRCVRGFQAERICIGCGAPINTGMAVDDIAEKCRNVLRVHFEIDRDIYPGYSMNLERIIARAIDCENQKVVSSIAKLLEVPCSDDENQQSRDDFYSEGQEYFWASSPFSDGEQEESFVLGSWLAIFKDIKHGRRFFNKKAQFFFDELMSEALLARSSAELDVCPFITEIPAGTVLYRSRVVRNNVERASFIDNPAKELGAPPQEFAGNNRMSSAGIPVLYLSQDESTCLAEIRPSIGSSVAICGFRAIKKLKLFDLTALSRPLFYQPLSYFDFSYDTKKNCRALLALLQDEIAKPVKMGDNEYLMTQIFSEHIKFESKENFDGIMFQSVQNSKGTNFALFETMADDEILLKDHNEKFGVVAQEDSVKIVNVNAINYLFEDSN